MIQRFRNSYITKGLAVLMILNMIGSIIQPNALFALTAGPSQPEMHGFTPIGTSENVNLSTGSFNYNIPLMDVGGYPINMAYNSGVTMDQEASWVGLGWSLNPGVMNRTMRGVPDDFKGDKIKKDFNMKDNISVGVSIAGGVEMAGFEVDFSESLSGEFSLTLGMGVNYNNYAGWGTTFSATPNFDFAKSTSDDNTAELGLGVSLTASDDGLNINPDVSFSSHENTSNENNTTSTTSSVGVGLAFNSREGFKGATLHAKASKYSETELDANQKDALLKYFGITNPGPITKKSAGSTGSSISMPSNTYVPMVEFPKINAGVSFSGKLGTGFFTADGTMDINGYYMHQGLRTKNLEFPAFGYQNSQDAQDLQKVIHDFNREKDVSYTKGSPNLPVTNYTYDLYSAVGQGMAGMFRPFRSDIGHVYDSRVSSTGVDGALGIDFTTGNLVDGGFDLDLNISTQTTKKWKNWTNKAKNKFEFQKLENGSLFEPVYFKQVGELAVDEDPLLSNMGGFDPVAIKLKYTFGNNVEAMQTLYSNTDISIPVNFETKRTVGDRAKRNMVFSQLSVEESELVGLPIDEEIYSGAEDYHNGEISVVRADGVKYIYGLPAYNTLQKEVTFSVGDASDDGSGKVTYVAGVDNSVNNQNGIDHFYEATTLPPFAHSYLLTAVVSADYVDRTNDGPSADDYGTYTKFTYNQAYDEYDWRVPYEENKANLNEGLRTLDGDNKASYIYGQKEIWYLEKIETKTHVAIFTTGNRHDAHESDGENGGEGLDSMKKLEKISLFTKPDYEAHILDLNDATPIKEVHFVYDYYLCPNVPNNDGDSEIVDSQDINENKGKLTLREVYFSYGKSDKGKLSAYKFKYGDVDGIAGEDAEGNAPYDLKDYNMWGTFKPNEPTTYSQTNNAENPYVEQDKAQEDINVAQWHLTDIILPSGGQMKINYESNDYSSVQNKGVMEFLNVVGTAESKADITSATYITDLENRLWGDGDNSGEVDYLWTVVELPDGAASYTDSKFKDKMLRPLGDDPIRFNFYMDLEEKSAGSAGWSMSEYVSGYAEIDDAGDYADAGIVEINGEKYGCFKFKAVHEENKDGSLDSHPIAKTTWQWVRIHNPHVAYDQVGGTIATGPGSDQTGIVEAIGASISSFAEVFNGPNGFIRNKGIGKYFNRNKSWVRLPTPSDNKLGGGSRVKTISLTDEWDEMTNDVNEGDYYGQEYKYIDEEGASSGVATFEPIISKENPLITPLSFDVKRFMVPDDKYVIEKPYGLSFYPTPKITYGRVEVSSINKVYERDLTNYVSGNRTGKTVTEFYTTKDFPTIVRQTKMDSKPFSPDLITKLLKLNSREHANVSQGYVIELNDMDGKLKSQMVYAEGNDVPITGVRHIYASTTIPQDYDDLGITGLQNISWDDVRLDNNALTIGADGTVEEHTIGVEYDIITDFRQNRTENISGGVDSNLGNFLISIGFTVPSFFPTFSRQVTRFRSAVTTKVINRYGLLREVVTFDNGAAVSTENLAWDRETGEVLLTKTKNEFSDPFYSMKFPAHWTYDRMGQAYKNIGLTVGAMTASGGDYYAGTGSSNFVKGDEVLIAYNNGTSDLEEKAWVLDVSGSDVYFIDIDGNPLNVTSISSVKVIRSGRRNQQSLPVGLLTMKSDPTRDDQGDLQDMADNSFDDTYSDTEVISASATEFSEDWGLKCGGFEEGYTVTEDCELTANMGDYVINGSGTFNKNIDPCPFYVFEASNYDPLTVDQVITAGPVPGVNGFVGAWPSWNSLPNIGFTNISLASPLSDNVDLYHLEFNADFGGSTGTDYILYNGYMGEWCPLWECYDGIPDPNVELCGIQESDIINPFVENVQGVWRSLKGWTKLGLRHQMNFDLAALENPDQLTNIRTQGKYEDFNYFWTMVSNKWVKNEINWTWVKAITAFRGYDQDGMERENMDALFRFSAAINGYANTLPIAVAANATYRQIGYDGFEDYDYYDEESCKNRHFAFENATRSSAESHTGRYSMELSGNSFIGLVRTLEKDGEVISAKTIPYEVRDCECQGNFGPETYDVRNYAQNQTVVAEDKKYVLSYWVKRSDQGPLVSNYTGLDPIVTADGTTLTLSAARKSNIIDGWQKVEYSFTIDGISLPSAGVSLFTLSFNNTQVTKVYLDDIRIQPFNSSMATYVYDAINLRLMAQLDDNNFATFYEYNEEGGLIRIKKETERGIVTIQESRSGVIKGGL
ncbi:MAG: hypothetical protein ABJG68_07555 [Crocinitomicaceae bacterium]